MKFSNFKPNIWAEHVRTELKEHCILLDEGCNRHQGEIRRVKFDGQHTGRDKCPKTEEK